MKTYSVLMDVKMNLSGVAASPTDNSQHLFEESLETGDMRLDFDLGVTNGVGNVYLFIGSDSAATPFPEFTGNFRVWYFDE